MEAVRLMGSANSFNYSSWVILECAVTGQTVLLLHRCLFFFHFLTVCFISGRKHFFISFLLLHTQLQVNEEEHGRSGCLIATDAAWSYVE